MSKLVKGCVIIASALAIGAVIAILPNVGIGWYWRGKDALYGQKNLDLGD